MSISKNVLLNLYSLMKNNQEDSDVFNKFLWVCYFLAKNLSNLAPPSLENSTTGIAILTFKPKLSHFKYQPKKT